MADQKRWFKVWTSLLVDMDNLADELVGRWVKLGCRIALVGTHGSVTFDNWRHVARFFNVTEDVARETLTTLPSISVEEGEKHHGKITVTMKNWIRYQEDSTQAERQKSSRAKRRGEETRREEKRKDESRSSAGAADSDDLFEDDAAAQGENEEGEGAPIQPDAPWGTPDALVALYNASVPDDHPKAPTLSPGRLRKCREYLRRFPKRDFWVTVFAELSQSDFLRYGTEDRRIARGLDWLLTVGKDQVENCVKTGEGKYRNNKLTARTGAHQAESTDREARLHYLKTGEKLRR